MSGLAVLSLKNRALIALVTICAAIFGGLALNSLKQELIPSIELPTLMVMSTYPGASPDVVENDVSTPIEDAVQAVEGLESSTATSTANASLVQATFAYGTDLAGAEQDIQRAISQIQSALPDDVEPQVMSFNLDDVPVIQVAVSSTNDDDLASVLQDVATPALQDVDGVGTAGLVGSAADQVVITPDADELAAQGLTPQAISAAVQQNGLLLPGGEIDEDGKSLTVQTGAKLASVDDIEALPIAREPVVDPATGIPSLPPVLAIADVASVEVQSAEQTSISRVNGEEAISISVTKRPDANTVEVSNRVIAELDQLRESIPDAEFTIVFDQAPYIVQSIETLAVEGMLGLAFAVIIILVFLMSVRSTIVTAISIPTSVLMAFVGMQAFGYSLNMLTLGALTISIGRVVDDSIVVIENIKRHYVDGASKIDAIRQGVREVAGAITASTMTSVAVFLPIAFVGDMVGELFRPFAVTVALAMGASLLVSLTIVPVLAYWFIKPGKRLLDANGAPIDPEHPDAPPSRLQRGYLPLLRWTLKHSWVTLTLSVLVLVGTAALSPFMNLNFLGDSGQNSMTISQTLEDGANLERKDEAAQTVEDALTGIDGIDVVQVSVGSSGSGPADAFGGGSDVSYSITTSADADQEQLRATVSARIGELDDVGEVTVSGAQGLGASDIEVQVIAPSEDDLVAAVDAITASLDGRDGIGDTTSDLAASLSYLAVEVDRDAAAELGLTEQTIGGIVSSTMLGDTAGSIEIDGTSLDIVIETEDAPTTVQQLRDLMIPSAVGQERLDEIATIEERESPASIATARGQRAATIAITPTSDDLQVAVASVTAALDSAELPAGATATVGGVAEAQADAFEQLGLAMLAAILIVYVIMVATFKSLRQPLLLLVSVPFAATGGVILQVVTGVPLGVASLIGVLMLIGIVVTNAIVLVDLVNQYREKGLDVRHATEVGSSMRLRPILMTALATIFALVPMALGITGHGGFISQPLAIVVIGGLVSSTVLTLIVLPTLYNLVEGAKERRATRRAARGSGGSDGGPAGGGSVEPGDGSDGSGGSGDTAGAPRPPSRSSTLTHPLDELPSLRPVRKHHDG